MRVPLAAGLFCLLHAVEQPRAQDEGAGSNEAKTAVAPRVLSRLLAVSAVPRDLKWEPAVRICVRIDTFNTFGAETIAGVEVAFQVDGFWSGDMPLISAAGRGEIVEKTMSLTALPTRLRLRPVPITPPVIDAWGFRRILVTEVSSNLSVVVLDSCNGAACAYSVNSPHWLSFGHTNNTYVVPPFPTTTATTTVTFTTSSTVSSTVTSTSFTTTTTGTATSTATGTVTLTTRTTSSSTSTYTTSSSTSTRTTSSSTSTHTTSSSTSTRTTSSSTTTRTTSSSTTTRTTSSSSSTSTTSSSTSTHTTSSSTSTHTISTFSSTKTTTSSSTSTSTHTTSSSTSTHTTSSATRTHTTPTTWTSTATASTDTSITTVFLTSKRATPGSSITLTTIPTYTASRAAFKIGMIPGTTETGPAETSAASSMRDQAAYVTSSPKSVGAPALTGREVNGSLGSAGEVEYSPTAGAGVVHSEHAHVFLIGSIASCVVGASILFVWRHARQKDKIHPEGLGIMPAGLEEGSLRIVVSGQSLAAPAHAWPGSGLV